MLAVMAALGVLVPFTGGAPPGATARAGTATRAVDGRPNIVLITTDDQATTDMRWMPKTRRLLGSAGVEFTDSLSPHPLCCPARAQILTGQYAQNNGVRTNQAPFGGSQRLDSAHTLPVWLQRAGYRTALVGKYLNGFKTADGIQPGWDVFNPTTIGVYRYFNYVMFNNGDPVRYRKLYNTDLVARDTSRYVRRFAATGQPFFIWSSYVAPHSACRPSNEPTCWQPEPVPDPRYRHFLNRARTPAFDDPGYNERDVSDKPPFISQRGKVPSFQVATVFQDRLRTLASVDDAVARTVQALRDAGQLANTLIVFTSDNGFLLGQHRFVGKELGFEQAMRTPLLVRGPGVPSGTVRHQTVATIDLAPTFLESAQASPDITLDGQSIWPFVRGSAQRRGDVLVQAGPRSPIDPFGWMFRGVRTKRYTYTAWPATGAVELYDRLVDPHELDNVANLPQYASVRAELARRTRLLEDCSGADCRTQFPALSDDVRCSTFSTQRSAQRFFLEHRPAADPYGLDPDGDRIACENRPCTCLFRTQPPRGPAAVQPRRARVLRVVDGETLAVELRSGAHRRVRLLDVDSPAPRGAGSCGGTHARGSLRQLLPRKAWVRLVADPAQPRRDERHRLLRYVVRNGLDVNRAQLSRGWAVVTYDNDRPFHRFNGYVSAQRDADRANRGMWSFCPGLVD